MQHDVPLGSCVGVDWAAARGRPVSRATAHQRRARSPMGDILTAILGNGVLIASLVALYKLWFEQQIRQSTVRFEKDLQAAHDSSLEALKAELRLTEQRTTRFDDRRFEALGEVYAAIADANDAFARWTRFLRMGGSPTEEEDAGAAFVAYDALLKAQNRNRLWLGSALAAQVDELVSALHSAWVDFVDPKSRDWKAVHETMRTRVPALRREFEAISEDMLRGWGAGAR